MHLHFLFIGLATSSLVLTGVRSPGAVEPGHYMLRDSGDLWSPADPGSNVLPCGDWGKVATRMGVVLGEEFLLTGTVPKAAGGGVLTVEAIFHESPNFNLAGVLYDSHRFSVQDVGDQPANFTVPVTLPEASPPGPVSLQVKFVALKAKHPFYQCVDLLGLPAQRSPLMRAMEWWLVGIGAGVFLLIACCVVYCCYCRKHRQQKAKTAKDPWLGGATTKAAPVMPEGELPSNFKEVSLQDPREADSEREGPSYVRSDVEIEDLTDDFDGEQQLEQHEERGEPGFAYNARSTDRHQY